MKKVIFLICALVACITSDAYSQEVSNDATTRQLQKLNQFYQYLNGTYVESVDMEPLVEKAIEAMLLELDPHSAYINAEDTKSVTENFEGEFSGIGVEFNVLQDTIIVVNTIVGGPAEKVGIMPNDRIVIVDNESVVGIKQNEVPRMLRGEKGSKVNIKAVRHGEAEMLDFIVERDNIPIHTVDAAYMLDNKIGYIKVNRFGATTFKEFHEAYEKLSKEGELKSLVLDLRGNGGGYLSQAVKLSNFFLPKGSLIVSTEGEKIPSSQLVAEKNGEFTKGDVIILIDENSASASEIVAGALQDWDRATIIGRPSFGKGLVQRQFPLIDGSLVRITIARYHTPTGRVIQRPYEKGKSEDYYSRHAERFASENGDSLSRDTLDVSKRPAYKTLREGRTVYGGGGITPDIVIKESRDSIAIQYIELIRKSIVNEFVVSYLDKNRAQLDRDYPTFEVYNRNFEVDSTMINSLIERGKAKGVSFDKFDSQSFDDIAKVNLKALFAQKLFNTSEFYQVVNENDKYLFPPLMEVLQGRNKE